MRFLFLLLFSLSPVILTAQNNNQELIHRYTFEQTELARKSINIQPYTAIQLRNKEPIDFTAYKLVVPDDTIRFYNDPHNTQSDSYFYSTIIHLDSLSTELRIINSLETNDEITIISVNGSITVNQQQHRDKVDPVFNNCDKPGIIQQVEWRAGLSAPSYNRIQTETNHVILHHSAGSNNITNFTQAVRDIYLFHTEERGWSDIGYNYLIAPDGSIYAGRDPGAGDQDLVMGAHFCGSNSNTMGICTLGNYESVKPERSAVQSLINLISWKVDKDDLNPIGTEFHPLNNNLPTIAGHQDGCATLCPGKYLYKKIDSIRAEVQMQKTACSNDSTDENEEDKEPITIEIIKKNTAEIPEYTVFPNPAESGTPINIKMEKANQIALEQIEILNQQGKKISLKAINFNKNYISIKTPSYIRPGFYYIYIRFNDQGIINRKILLR